MTSRHCSTSSAGRSKAIDTVRFLCATLVLLYCATASGESAEVSPTIRSITISGNTRTRTDVIRRELLFAEGEPLDSVLVAETARNLRRLLFLGEVALDTASTGSHVDIVVRVRDLHARTVTPLLAGDRDELSYGVLAMDYNFQGRGQIAQLTLEHDAVTGNRAEAYYRIPRLGISRWAVTGLAAVREEGHQAQATFSHPYFALSTRWTAGGTGYSHDRIERLYTNGRLSTMYRDRLCNRWWRHVTLLTWRS
jgi:outer membrane protein assembly factor BamA